MKKKTLILSVALVLCASCLFLIIYLMLPKEEIRFDQANKTFIVKGDVKIRKTGDRSQWQKMKTSTVLEKGDVIETAGESYVTIIIGDDNNKVINVGQKSHVEFQDVNPTAVNLSKGKVLVSIKKLESKSSFMVKTPVAICGARGTGWSQEASGDVTKICVFENEVHLQSVDVSGKPKGKKYAAAEWTQRILEKNKPISGPEKINEKDVEAWKYWYKRVDFLREGNILVDDFYKKENFNNLDGAVGSWNMFYYDPTQFCKDEFTDKERIGDSGYSLKLTYDVNSQVSAYNGFFTKLVDIDLTGYRYLIFYIKGDKAAGYTTKVNVELKNIYQIGRATVDGVTDEWKKMVVPLGKFVGITDLKDMKEFVIVFSDIAVTRKEGVVYLDDIYFAKSE